MVSTDARYVYKGSLTTPPCTESIYWNVVTKVYPIKVKHLEAFRSLWQKSADITYEGNYRLIQKLNPGSHQPAIMEPVPVVVEEEGSSTEAVLRIVFVALIVLFTMIGGLSYIAYTTK